MNGCLVWRKNIFEDSSYLFPGGSFQPRLQLRRYIERLLKVNFSLPDEFRGAKTAKIARTKNNAAILIPSTFEEKKQGDHVAL